METINLGTNPKEMTLNCLQKSNFITAVLTIQKISLYCIDCDSLICRDCCATIHRNHECQFIDEIEDEFGSQLDAQIEVQSQNLSKISNRLDRVRDRKLEFENRTKNIENEVEKYIEEYIHVIRNHGENLKKSIRERRTKQLEEYDEIIEEIQDFEISSEQSIDTAIQAGDIGGSQMLSMLPTIRNRLDQLHSRSKSIKRLIFRRSPLIDSHAGERIL